MRTFRIWETRLPALQLLSTCGGEAPNVQVLLLSSTLASSGDPAMTKLEEQPTTCACPCLTWLWQPEGAIKTLICLEQSTKPKTSITIKMHYVLCVNPHIPLLWWSLREVTVRLAGPWSTAGGWWVDIYMMLRHLSSSAWTERWRRGMPVVEMMMESCCSTQSQCAEACHVVLTLTTRM